MMFVGIFTNNKKHILWAAQICMLLLIGACVIDFTRLGNTTMFFNGMLKFSKYSYWVNLLLSACSLLYLLIFGKSILDIGKFKAEYFALIFFILCGIFLLSSYNHLLILFIGIEILSIPQYILAGSDKENLKSNEAALKYFLMGAFSTGILLMGITLIYGAVGSFEIHALNNTLLHQASALPAVGILLVLIAMGFKVSAAPMHWWTADVYDGTPTAITPFMASVVKTGAFIAFVRLFHEAFGQIQSSWAGALAFIIAATLFVGNITAVYQQSVKRMLAYSSIAQAGFMLFAVFSLNAMAEKSIVYYSVAYILATLGIFAVLIKLKDYTIEGFNGLAKKEPLVAFTATISLLSLAGIPITSGFFAKYMLLASFIKQGYWLWLAIFAVLMAAVGVYYYFRVIRSMYFKSGNAELDMHFSLSEKILLLCNALLILILGLFPQLITG